MVLYQKLRKTTYSEKKDFKKLDGRIGFVTMGKT